MRSLDGAAYSDGGLLALPEARETSAGDGLGGGPWTWGGGLDG